MPVAPDVQSLTTAAEEAASGGDFATAAQYLELAAGLQDAGTGAMPVELANTLNNLGVVYETLDRPAEAERSYRRAYAVARAVLPADHPSVALCEKNLRDFCEGRGIPFEPDSAPVVLAPPVAALTPSAPAPSAVEDSRPGATLPAAADAEREPRIPPVALGVGVLVLGALLLVGVRWFGSQQSAETTTVTSAPAPVVPEPPPATPPEPGTPDPVPAPQPEPAPVASAPAPVRREPPPAARAAVVPTVVSASLCGSLETRGAQWQCAAPTGAPGTFFFYTRLAAPAPTTVEHRWYRDGRLHQTVTLRIPPNPRQGYRTYSRVTIPAARAGSWRAELRVPGGDVLHEEQFSVAP